MGSFLDIFAAPNDVFNRIREKTLSAWLALIIVLLVSTATMAWYFMTVDLYQFMETSMAISGQTATSAELDTILQQEGVIRIVSTVTTSVSSLVMFFILGLFFFLAALVAAEEKITYGQCLAVVAWGSVPGLISVFSMAISWFLANDFVYLTALDQTSLANLLGMTVNSPNFDVFSIFSVGTIWSYALFGIGFAKITRSSAVTATVVGIIPPTIHIGLTYLF